jgi:hypothetical protein
LPEQTEPTRLERLVPDNRQSLDSTISGRNSNSSLVTGREGGSVYRKLRELDGVADANTDWVWIVDPDGRDDLGSLIADGSLVAPVFETGRRRGTFRQGR